MSGNSAETNKFQLIYKAGNIELRTHHISVAQSVVDRRVAQLSLHGFSDASKKALCAAIYVVETYSVGQISQNILTSKARVAPRNLSIPRLELVAAQTLANWQREQGTQFLEHSRDHFVDGQCDRTPLVGR